MKILKNHLYPFLSEKPSVKDLSETLFQLGHENEVVGDILDIDITPNRGDCLSVRGIARDLKYFYGNNNMAKNALNNFERLDLNFINRSKTHCPKISFLNIEIDNNIKDYKDYLKVYFDQLGIPKNNFFTDISNYLMYEIGQPTHCYDFKKIGKSFELKTLKNKCEFKTVTGKQIEIEKGDLVFIKDDEIIGLAGIMGGDSTSCDHSTTNVLIECAYFDPEIIIGKSIKYNLNSEAAYRFERGTDIQNHRNVLKRFIEIIEDHAVIKDIKIFEECSTDCNNKTIKFDPEKINNILGTSISSKSIINILESLGFKFKKDLIVPSYRNDISNDHDIAEEIARIEGYDSLPYKDLYLNTKRPNKSVNVQLIKSFLVDKGFYECINIPFTDHYKDDSIEIDNPLDKNKRFLRSEIKSSLIDNLTYNENRQKDSIKIFEISDINTKSSFSGLKKLSIIASGRAGKNHKEFSKIIDKSYLEDILHELCSSFDFRVEEVSRSNIDSKSKSKIFCCEILIDNLCSKIDFENIKTSSKIPSHEISYTPISEFPFIVRDISFLVEDDSKLADLNDLISETSEENLVEFFLFDFYRNEESGVSKLGYRFIFQSNTKTLTDSDVSNSTTNIIESSFKIKGVSVPGY